MVSLSLCRLVGLAILASTQSLVSATNLVGTTKLGAGVRELSLPISRRADNIHHSRFGARGIGSSGRHTATKRDMHNHHSHTDRKRAGDPPSANNNGIEPSAGCKKCDSSLKFAKASKYEVGNNIPSLPFKTKTSWAGDMPIRKSAKGDDRGYFFWLWGKDDKDDKDTDLVIWLNGGPGCSSMVGMTTELGPWMDTSIAKGPYPNKYSWTRAAHMIYLEQPTGVGFTIGNEAELNDEDDVAKDFDSFLENFFETFSELKGRNLYITGESYGGAYIPHIVSYQYANGNKYNVQGALIGDGKFSTDTVQQDLITYDIALRYKDTLGFDHYDIEPLRLRALKCGYLGYLGKHLNYPAQGPMPNINQTGCFSFYSLYYYAKDLVTNFNVYNIKKPHNDTDDPLGPQDPDKFDPFKTFFDNPELQKYIHAPQRKWDVCKQVFKHKNGDQVDASVPVVNDGTLAKMIEGGKRSTLLAGGLDMLLAYEGIQLAVQNMTWAGKQGFDSPPDKPYADIDGDTTKARHVNERKLSLVIVPEAGHMVPADQPTVGLKALYDLIDKPVPKFT